MGDRPVDVHQVGHVLVLRAFAQGIIHHLLLRHWFGQVITDLPPGHSHSVEHVREVVPVLGQAIVDNDSMQEVGTVFKAGVLTRYFLLVLPNLLFNPLLLLGGRSLEFFEDSQST